MSSSRVGAPAVSPERRRALEIAGLGAGPLVLSLVLLAGLVSGHNIAFDFEREYAPAVHRWLEGATPYVAGPRSVAHGVAFPYTALALLLSTPFALMPGASGYVLFTLVLLGCAGGVLRLLGIGDWRLYGLAFMSAPVLTAWTTANFTLIALAALALGWRWRDRPLMGALAAAIAISLKPFMWPFWLWMLATGRIRSFGWSLFLALVFNLGAFAAVGWNELGPFLHDTRAVSEHFLPLGYGIAAVGVRAGATRTEALGIALVVAGLVSVGGFVLARRDERRALGVFSCVMLLASPIVWMHYLTVLLLPLALLRPRLEPIWLLGLILWVAPLGQPSLAENLVVVAVIGAQVTWMLKDPAEGVAITERSAVPGALRGRFAVPRASVKAAR